MKSIFIAAMFIVGQIAFAADTEIKIVAFNVLAAPWASPLYYPSSSLPYLDRNYRVQKTIAVLQNLSVDTDVFCLQETTPVEFQLIANSLPDYLGLQANHASTYWSQWVTEVPPWELNGNAILVKKSKFKDVKLSDIALSSSGNHAA